MHFVLFTAFAVVVYVCHFNEVCCKENDIELEFWKRDKKYDKVAKSLSHVYRRIIHDKPKHRLRSAQRRWERQQRQMVLDNLDRNLEKQDNKTRQLVKQRRNFLNDGQQPHLNSEAKTPSPQLVYVDDDDDYDRKYLESVLDTMRLVQEDPTEGQTGEPTSTKPTKQLISESTSEASSTKETTPTKPTKQVLRELTYDTGKPIKKEETSTKSTTHATSSSMTAKQNKKILSPYSLLQDLKDLIVPAYPDYNITLEVLGRTVEYNDLVLMKVTGNITKYYMRSGGVFEEEVNEKKVVFIVHGLSVMGFNELPCMKKLDSVLTLYSYYFKHLDKFDIYIMPMANPDGVPAAMMKSFWNKNVSPQSACPGVALDRNFDIAWNETFSTLSSCAQQYPGPYPFSEIETQAIRDIFHKYGHKMIGYLNVHSGTYAASIFKGDAVLYPKGYTESNTDEDKYLDLRGELDEMMRNADFRVYSVTMDSLYNWYGKVSGTSVDYAAVSFGVPFCMEFVMQLYDDDMMVQESTDRETNAALTEVWSRVIDVIFPFMHRSYARNDAKRRTFWFFSAPNEVT